MGSYLSSPQVLSRKFPGQYRVGCKDLMIGQAPDEKDHGLFMKLFFPTDDEDAEISSYPLWLPRAEYARGLGDYLGESPHKIDLITSVIIGKKRVDCIDSARLSSKCDKWPIVIFSHGLGGSRMFYSMFCTSLASHGYIVAAVEHRDHSACWTYELREKDGVLVEKHIKIKLIEGNNEKEFKLRNDQARQRVHECEKALKILEEFNSGTIPERMLIGNDFNWGQLKNRLEVSSAFIIGHSFGGAASIASTGYSTKFQKAVVLDGWMFPLDSTQQEEAKQPVMFLNVGDWQWNENLEVMKKILLNNDANILLTLNGAVHQCFSDFPFIFPHWIAKQFGVQGPTEAYLCIQAAIDLTVAFLREGKEGAQKMRDDKFCNFITNEIYGREKIKV